MSLGNKSVLITGCAPGGIGNALARQFHVSGRLRVFATARNRESLADLNGLGIETLSLDVNSASNVAEVKSSVEALTGGSLDYLVNNAGRNYTVPALDVDFAEVRSTFETNLFAVMRMCQTFSPLLIKSKGTIVQIGSLAGVIPYVFGSVYNASKAAMHSYSDTLRVELSPFGVKVFVVVTGGVQSRIARTDRQLSSGSLYIPVEEEYLRRVKHSQEGAMPAEEYALRVVNKVLRSPSTLSYWQGAKSWMVWLVNTLMPRQIWIFVFARMFNLYKLRASTSATKKID